MISQRPGSRALQWPTLAKLGLWYLLLLLPTLYFKYSYLNSLAEEGVLAAVASRSELQSVVRYVSLFDSDFVQVLFLVAGVYAVGHLLLRIGLDALVGLSVLICVLVSAGNWLSFQVIGSLLNADNLEIALSWLKEHPQTVTADQGGKLLLLSAVGLFLLALLWTIACFLAMRGGVNERSAPFLARVTLAVALMLQLIAGGDALYQLMHPRHEAATSRGYWSSTLTSLRGAEHWAPLQLELPPVATIEAEYRKLVYDNSAVPETCSAEEAAVQIPLARRVPRHIVFISLETAARKYYPIRENPALPTFSRMAGRGISSDFHLSTNPTTTWATYSMLTGTYPRRGRSLLDYGEFASDGLASVLRARGYETTFLDSYKIDWQSGFYRKHNSRMVNDLGFTWAEDITTDSARQMGGGDPFDRAVARERRSLARALQRIDEARARHEHAFIFIATILGHFPWNAPAAAKNHSAAAKLAVIGQTLDTLMGEFLAGVQQRGLSDSIIVVVTGDHGLRARQEFGSLGEPMRFGSISFNVPFILYAPGIFDRGVRLTHVTSHVDIAPTLYALVGIAADSLLLHGSSMLDPLVRERTTFMFNNSLRPLDGYYKDGWFFIYNAFTGEARAEQAPGMKSSPVPAGFTPNAPASLAFNATVGTTLDRAAGIFDITAAYFLQRRARMKGERALTARGAAH